MEECRKSNTDALRDFKGLINNSEEAFIRARECISKLRRNFEQIFRSEVFEKDESLHMVLKLSQLVEKYEAKV